MDKRCECQPGFVPAPTNPKQANGCSPCSYLTTEILPANLGDDNPKNIQWAPKKGRWHDKIVVYAANGATYLYDHNGEYVQLSMGKAGVQSVNDMTGIVNLPNLTLSNGKSNYGKYNAGKEITILLPIPELGTVTQGDTGYVNGNMAYELEQSVQTSLQTETTEREQSVAQLQGQVTANQLSIDATSGTVGSLTKRVEALDNNLDQLVQRNTTVFSNADTVTVTKTLGNISEASTTYQDTQFPMANENQAGCITAEMYNKIKALIGE